MVQEAEFRAWEAAGGRNFLGTNLFLSATFAAAASPQLFCKSCEHQMLAAEHSLQVQNGTVLNL